MKIENMTLIKYRIINKDELSVELFNDFIRHQIVAKCWRKENSKWTIKDVPFIDDWTKDDYKILVSCLENTINTGGLVYGAFYDNKLKGFVSVESENILAFTPDCNYQVRFIGSGIFSQKGLATSTLTGKGPNAYVALLCNGNPIVLSNVNSNSTLCVDPDAVICWFSQRGYCDPQIKTDLSWKNFIGQASGESYSYEWNSHQPVTVLVQPNERIGGIRVGID